MTKRPRLAGAFFKCFDPYVVSVEPGFGHIPILVEPFEDDRLSIKRIKNSPFQIIDTRIRRDGVESGIKFDKLLDDNILLVHIFLITRG